VTGVTYRLADIQGNQSVCAEYLYRIPNNVSVREAITAAHRLCPELARYNEKNLTKFSGLRSRDKGSMGKIAEFFFFGQLPDSLPAPDLSWGADIKATHFKTNKQGHYNAKERLTITNCGDRNDYTTFDALMSAPDVRSCKYYLKLRRGVLFVFEHRGGKYNDLNENMSKRLLCCLAYDLEGMPDEITTQIDADFEHIQSTIRAGAITQAGQIYLHTAPHGAGHGSGHRALAFTNKFVTKIVSFYTGKPITVKGRSWFIDKKHFYE
jgi:hypothetical protein